MSYEKLIHEYLDTGLDETAEQSLFAEVSKNSEVRTEFNHQVRLNNIASKDMQTIMPPSELTKDVFSTLGFTPPASNPVIPVASLSSSLKKYASHLFTAIIGATFSYFLFTNISGTTSSELNKPQLSELNSSVGNNSESSNSMELSFISGVNSRNINNIELVKPTEANKLGKSNYNNYNNNNDQAQKTNTKAENQTEFSLMDSFKANMPSENYNNNNEKSFFDELVDNLGNVISNGLLINSTSPEEILSENTNANIDYNSNNGIDQNLLSNNSQDIEIIETEWTVQLRVLSGKSTPDVNLNTEAEFFDNISLSVLYDVNYDFYVGAEFGKEKYGLEYNRTIAGSNQLEAKNPSLFWYGANVKYMPSTLFANQYFNPYAQIGIGASSIGPMARGQAGFYLRPDARFSLLLGFEFSKLWYKSNEDVWYNSFNQGYSLGINYNF